MVGWCSSHGSVVWFFNAPGNVGRCPKDPGSRKGAYICWQSPLLPSSLPIAFVFEPVMNILFLLLRKDSPSDWRKFHKAAQYLTGSCLHEVFTDAKLLAEGDQRAITWKATHESSYANRFSAQLDPTLPWRQHEFHYFHFALGRKLGSKRLTNIFGMILWISLGADPSYQSRPRHGNISGKCTFIESSLQYSPVVVALGARFISCVIHLALVFVWLPKR